MTRLKGTALFVAAILLTGSAAWAQRDTGGSGDPTVKPGGDPHGAIRSMSQAADDKSKPDHSVTTVPSVLPPNAGAAGGAPPDTDR